MVKDWDAALGERSPRFRELLGLAFPGGDFFATAPGGQDDRAGVDYWGLLYTGKDAKKRVPIAARVRSFKPGWRGQDVSMRYDYPLIPERYTEYHRLMGDSDPGFLVYAMIDDRAVGYVDAVVVRMGSLRARAVIGDMQFDGPFDNPGAYDPAVRDSRYIRINIEQWGPNSSVRYWRWSDALEGM